MEASGFFLCASASVLCEYFVDFLFFYCGFHYQVKVVYQSWIFGRLIVFLPAVCFVGLN